MSIADSYNVVKDKRNGYEKQWQALMERQFVGSAENDNGLERRHDYDAGGRLHEIAYATPDAVLGHFAYTLDARGNRIAATETLKSPTAGSTTILSDDDALDYYQGSWSASGVYMESTNFSAALRLAFLGDEITLTLGQDSDHGICDIYVNNVLWGSLDTFAASAGDEAVTLTLDSEGPHVLDIRNRPDNHMSSTGYRLSFKQLVTNAQYDLHTVQYTYDGLSRLIEADYFEGENVDGTAFREYDFAYDLAGNRTQQVVEIAGSPTTTNYTYDAANRLTAVDAQSITYNNAGQMTDDGTLTYSWDRGGRLLSAGSSSYAYNGLGNRLSQTVSAVVTDYLLDLQPGLSKTLVATTGANVDRFVHTPQGIQSIQNNSGDWLYTVQDGLNSVRSIVDDTFDVLHSQHYAPYGEPFGESGTSQTDFGFTGEPTDGNGLVHLRARYLDPELGVFPSLDPVEGALQQAMSLNRYGYVAGNVVNAVDPSGWFGEKPGSYDQCQQNTDEECTCGPNVEQWFKEELAIHYEWVNQNSERSFWEKITITAGYLHHLSQFALYAKHIPYKWIDFNCPEEGCPAPDTPTGNKPWERPCGGSVTLCGCCLERSELGNFMFGFAGTLWGLPETVVDNGARGFGLSGYGVDLGRRAREWDREAWLVGIEFGREILDGGQISFVGGYGPSRLDYPDVCSFIAPRCADLEDPRNDGCQPCTAYTLGDNIRHTTPSTGNQGYPEINVTPRTYDTNQSSCTQ